MKCIIRKHKKCIGCGDFGDYWLPIKIDGKHTLRCINCAGSDVVLREEIDYVLEDYWGKVNASV